MLPGRSDHDYNLSRLIIRSLYFGLVVNILVPMGLLILCYYLDQRGDMYNRIGAGSNNLFYFLAALSVGQAAFALWYRHHLSGYPMIRKMETFEEDLAQGLLEQSRPVFLLIGGISLFGVVFYFITALFQEAAMLVVFSFIVFQVVRPRSGYVEKLITRQRALAESGQFRA